MGLLKHLLFWPVTGPTFLARFSLEKVQGVVRDELTSDTRVKEALLDLQLRLELGEIDDSEYEREEARLMAELREVRRWREEFGMATRGGVVRVEGDEGSERGASGQGGSSLPPGASLDVSLGWDEDEGSGERER